MSYFRVLVEKLALHSADYNILSTPQQAQPGNGAEYEQYLRLMRLTTTRQKAVAGTCVYKYNTKLPKNQLGQPNKDVV